MMKQQQQQQQQRKVSLALAMLGLALAIESAAAVITVQIGGATRLNSLSRQRERYNCYWDCDLVGCQIARDDDECAYDCEKICRVRYDYAATGRSGSAGGEQSQLQGKSSVETQAAGLKPETSSGEASNEISPELLGAGTSVRLHLPRNASARNFAIWERCAADANTGRLMEKPFNL